MNDFSKKTISNLSKKGVSITGKQAIPGFDGDKYFSVLLTSWFTIILLFFGLILR